MEHDIRVFNTGLWQRDAQACMDLMVSQGWSILSTTSTQTRSGGVTFIITFQRPLPKESGYSRDL